MAEMTEGGRLEGPRPEQDVLLATKLHVPRSRPGVVPRPRLADKLGEGMDRGLVLVTAPAGYGKSVLLSDWARSRAQPVAWLSLDDGDNDPARFWRHVLAALDAVRPGLSDRVGPLAGPPPPATYDALISALINDVAGEPGPPDVVLLLDDYHLISSPEVHASVRFLLGHRPAQLRIVLAGRSDPPIGLARYRGRGELGELRAADLRFSLDEAAELLRPASADLAPEAVAALTDRTEGWAAGLQLAALSLSGQPDIDRFVAAFTGSHRYILDYLTEEVLERLPRELKDFLLETSVLERLSGSLCDAVTGRDDSQERLEEADRSGLFVVQLDDVRGWWRYHHLFADLLRARLGQDPERARCLHRNAAGWYEQRGLPDEAIHHALAAGEQEHAARLVEENFDAVFNLRGEQATIGSWLPALSGDLVRSRPRLLLAQAQMASMRGDLHVVEPLLDAAAEVIDRADEEAFTPSTGREGSLLVTPGPCSRYSGVTRLSSGATPTPQQRGPGRPPATWIKTNGCSSRPSRDSRRWPTGSGGGWLTPRPPSSPASSSGGGKGRPPPRPGGTTASPACTEARGLSMPRSGRASGRWKPRPSREDRHRPPRDPR